MNLTFSQKTHFKRKYHSGLKIPVINTILCMISEDNKKNRCKNLTADDNYPFTKQNIAVYFSKKVSEKMHVYVYPDVIRNLWPIIVSILKYVTYCDLLNLMSDLDDDGIEFDELNFNIFEEIGKEYLFLKSHGYNATRIPLPCVDNRNL